MNPPDTSGQAEPGRRNGIGTERRMSRLANYTSGITSHLSRFTGDLSPRLLPTFFALCTAFLLGGILILFFGENPFEVYGLLWQSVFGSLDDFGYVLFNATPLIFTGLAVMLGFKGGLFNIGCEGQLYLAGFAAAWVGFHLNWGGGWIIIPACLIAAMLAGGLWGAIPGILKARYGVHEVINTIMLNFIAIALTNYLVIEVYKAPGQMSPHTPLIHEAARLPRLAAFTSTLPPSNPLNVTFFIALGLIALTQFLLTRTKWGYEIRFVGNAPEVATYGGIDVPRVTAWTMALSGIVAGFAGVWEVMGYRYRFLDNFSPGFGFTGIAVALLGRNHPYGVLFGALLFGALSKGALDIEIMTNVPGKLFLIIQGVLILLLVCAEGFNRHRTSE